MTTRALLTVKLSMHELYRWGHVSWKCVQSCNANIIHEYLGMIWPVFVNEIGIHLIRKILLELELEVCLNPHVYLKSLKTDPV